MVPMAPLGHKVQKVTPVIPGRKDHRGKSDLRVLPDWMVRMALSGHKVQKVTQVIQVRKAHRAKSDLRDLQE